MYVWTKKTKKTTTKKTQENAKIYIVYIEKKYERILVLFCNTLSMTKNKKKSTAFMQKKRMWYSKEQTNEYLSPE